MTRRNTFVQYNHHSSKESKSKELLSDVNTDDANMSIIHDKTVRLDKLESPIKMDFSVISKIWFDWPLRVLITGATIIASANVVSAENTDAKQKLSPAASRSPELGSNENARLEQSINRLEQSVSELRKDLQNAKVETSEFRRKTNSLLNTMAISAKEIEKKENTNSLKDFIPLIAYPLSALIGVVSALGGVWLTSELSRNREREGRRAETIKEQSGAYASILHELERINILATREKSEKIPEVNHTRNEIRVAVSKLKEVVRAQSNFLDPTLLERVLAVAETTVITTGPLISLRDDIRKEMSRIEYELKNDKRHLDKIHEIISVLSAATAEAAEALKATEDTTESTKKCAASANEAALAAENASKSARDAANSASASARRAVESANQSKETGKETNDD